MDTVVLIILLIIVTFKALKNKIAVLAVLLYYAEQGTELPKNEIMQKYTLKVVKKLLHIPN